MRNNGIIVLLACVGLSLGACTHSETPIGNDAAADKATGSGGSASGSGGNDQPGSGGDNGGTGGDNAGSGGGSGGAPVDVPMDVPTTDDAADGGADTADDTAGGDDGAADGDGPVATDDAGFPIGATIGSCFRLNWTPVASNSAPLDPPSSAIDDVPVTRWSTGTPQVAGLEYQIDFGGFVRLNQLRLDSSGSPGDFPRGLDVIASPDGFDFTNVIATIPVGDVAPADNVAVVDFAPVAMHTLLLRLTGTSGSWWSIHDLGVNCQIPDGQGGLTTDVPADNLKCQSSGTDGGVPSGPFDRANWTLTASSTSVMPTDVITNAIDGMAGTRWSSGQPQAPGQFLKVDLGSTGCIGQIKITSPGTDFTTGYTVSVSTDDNAYVAIAKGSGIAATTTTIRLPPHNARYVRIEQTGTSGSWWSISELTITP
ncbi:MAG: beta-glucosidase [Myxococcales bacterium]|nr:beta-glucosidase [Myxococcales bacterium]